jgi:hypothetical protein
MNCSGSIISIRPAPLRFSGGRRARAVACSGLALFLGLALIDAASACTTFCMRDGDAWIFGRNLDWSVEDGLVVVNKRGVAKTALTTDRPARWTSRYGSITFNQYGREFPMGGMNEAGLVVECLWLNVSEYPSPDDRAGLSALQWIQYQLDTAASIAEIMASDAEIRISNDGNSPLHFLVCDRRCGCASIEFLSGRMVVHAGAEMPITALTNNTYAASLAFWKACGGDEGSSVFRATESYSLKRFFWAAEGVRAASDIDPAAKVDHAFSILEKAGVGRTQWSIVYDCGAGTIHFLTRNQPSRRRLELDTFDFDCREPVLVLDMGRPGAGDVRDDFGAYTFTANRDLVRSAYAQTDFLKDVPEELLLTVARYPESTRCGRRDQSH